MTKEESRIYNKNYKLKNKQKIQQSYKEWASNNRSKKVDSNKKYRENNKEKIKIIYHQYRQENIQKIKDKEIEYYKNNKEIISKKAQERRKTERGKKLRQIEYLKLKQYKKHVLAWRLVLNNALVRLGKLKEGKTIQLLGYSPVELKSHIEKLFTENMSWQNHGEWHIDHIIPLSKFPKDTPMNVINALSNLQPLWKTTREINGTFYHGNLNKGNKII